MQINATRGSYFILPKLAISGGKMTTGTTDNVMWKLVHLLPIMLKIGMIVLESNMAISIKGYKNADSF